MIKDFTLSALARIKELERLLAHARDSAAENLGAKRAMQARCAELEKEREQLIDNMIKRGDAFAGAVADELHREACKALESSAPPPKKKIDLSGMLREKVALYLQGLPNHLKHPLDLMKERDTALSQVAKLERNLRRYRAQAHMWHQKYNKLALSVGGQETWCEWCSGTGRDYDGGPCEWCEEWVPKKEGSGGK